LDKQPKRSLTGLLLGQSLGAFNNNAWRYLVALLAVKSISDRTEDNGAAREALTQSQLTLAFVVFTVPLILCSLPAGVIADRLSKRSVLLALKLIELCLLAAGTVALFVNPAGGIAVLIVLGLMGVQSALVSPAKYGILPEILPHERLSLGNGKLEMCTFSAIILGTGLGCALPDVTGGQTWLAGLLLTAFAGLGVAATVAVPHVPAAGSGEGLVSGLRGAVGAMRGDRALWLSAVGLVFCWFLASLLGQDVLAYSKAVLTLSDTRAGLPLVACGLGVGVGSIAAGRLSASKVEYGLIPLGAIGLAVFTLLLGIIGPRLGGTLVLMALLGLSSGLLLVPLNAVLQWRAPADRRGAVIALANVLVFGGMLAGSLLGELLAWRGLSPRGIFIGAALITLAGTAWALRLLPDAFLRLTLVLVTHTLYRLRVVGRANVPDEGGALLTPNHVSFVDALFLIASLDRPVRFIVEATYFHMWPFRPLMRIVGAIPISASGGPKAILRALRDAGAYLDNGELVCIFPEGQLTRTGMLQPFRRGLERIVKGRKAPIVPVHLDHVWGSIFSRAGGRFVFKWPERIPYPVTVVFGAPLPAETTVQQLRQVVQDLGATAWELRKPDRRPLHHAFIRGARRRPWRFACADGSRPRVSRLGALTGAVVLARALWPRWQGHAFVGILLPPSVAGALANLAATLAGHTTVNLNYTAGRAGLTSAACQAGLRTVVTSRAFIDKAKLELPEGVEPIWIEDVAGDIPRSAKLWAVLLALFAPTRLLERACGAARRPSVDDLATVIFSSGSTGEPKGIMLSHFNIDANVEAAAQVLRADPTDRVLGILPLFHSFGFLTFWFAFDKGVGIVFHPSPLDAGAIGVLVERYRVTILLATPTFLQLYLRRCTPAQFGSLRIVLAGAEKLPERLVQAYEDHFGIRPLEGYGTTECAPVVAASVPDFRGPGLYQPGSRRAFAGQPLPGVAVRLVDPDRFEPVALGTPGMLLVKGPNVMRGYLGRDDLTAKAMHDGWYITGDLALQDEDGFLKITDRLSRFSKIGGEMVPHGRVEDALQEAAGKPEQVFAVTGLPDEKKGERLAVLHTLDEMELPAILDKLAASGLPNLFIPRRDQFLKIEKLPLLGTGKMDLREVKRIAAASLGE
jgi:acyl-[acyl-carrier-protein]-phospholipid O-acyltransferase/long-chain-fatty-acid--[acyl-carrier-protein] ligase